MKTPLFVVCLAGVVALLSSLATAQQPSTRAIEYSGKSVRGFPVSPAVRVGKSLLVSGTPGFTPDGKLDGDFPGQMKQAMENIGALLKSAGTGWNRVGKVTVFLTRREDFAE